MDKFKIISPANISSHIGDTDIPLAFSIGNFTEGTSGKLYIEISDTDDFTIKSILPVDEFKINGSDINGNVITKENSNKNIEINYKQPSNECKYIRVCINENGTVFISNAIYISTLTSLEIVFPNENIDFKPSSILFNDYYELDMNDDSLEFTVEVTNNALDMYPVWENATMAYIDKIPHIFDNDICINGSWSIRIRISAKKIKTGGTYKLYRISHIII